MVIVGVLAGILVGVIQASFFEWTFHRYWLHRPWLPKNVFTAHTLVHHQLCKHDDTFQVTEEEQEEALSFQWWGGPFLVFINMIPWLLISWLLFAAHVSVPSIAFCLALGTTIMTYYVGYEGIHFLMHKPSIDWIQRSRVFKFLDHHHRIHHVLMDRNLNVLCPLADLCLGTLILEAPPVTATPEAARRLARRYSVFGRRMKSEGQS